MTRIGPAWKANLFFYANLPPFYLDYTNGHFWSLCVEMQFYAAIAIVVALAGRRGLVLVPIVCSVGNSGTYRIRRAHLYRDLVANRRNTSRRMPCACF